MKIVGREKIDRFAMKHPTARKALARWRTVIESTSFLDTAHMRRTFGTVDFVKGYTVFNIKGNDFRLVALVVYVQDTLIIDAIMTHSDYDNWRPK